MRAEDNYLTISSLCKELDIKNREAIELMKELLLSDVIKIEE